LQKISKSNNNVYISIKKYIAIRQASPILTTPKIAPRTTKCFQKKKKKFLNTRLIIASTKSLPPFKTQHKIIDKLKA